MSKKNTINSPRLNEIRRKRHKALRNKVLFFSFLFIFLLTLASFALHIKKINIKNIEIVGNKVVENKDIIKIAENELNGNYLWIFPKSNFLIYPKNNIKNKLTTNLTRLNNISISTKDSETLLIETNEYEGKYLWCGINPVAEMDITNKCYFMDSSGYIFDEAPYFSGEIYFKIFGNSFNAQLNNNNPIGSSFLKENFNNLISFKNSLEMMGIQSYSFVLDENGDGNMFISKNLTGAKIIFKINSDYPKIIGNLESIINTEPLASTIKNKLNTLNYIDLRFGNKVYYKLQ